MIKKMFSAKVIFKVAIIVYCLMGVVFLLGLVAINLFFGSLWDAIFMTIVVTPFITLIATSVVATLEKSFFAVIGFLVIAIGTWIVPVVVISAEIHQDRVRASERVVNFEARMARIERSIGPVIREFYPNAEFEIGTHLGSNAGLSGVTRVRLDGFSWEQQPNFDYELEKWRGIMQIEAMRLYPGRIEVGYFFEDSWDAQAFARFNVNSGFYRDPFDIWFDSRDPFDMWFDSRGMSVGGFDIVKYQFEQYLHTYEEDFTLELDFDSWNHRLIVIIYRELQPYEEEAEENRWQFFLQEHDINTAIANITVRYRIPGTTGRRELGDSRSVGLRGFDWYDWW